MVRHPSLARAHNTCGGSTRAADPRRTLSAARQHPAESGRLTDGRASGQRRGDRAVLRGDVSRSDGSPLRSGGGGGVWRVTQPILSPELHGMPKFGHDCPSGSQSLRMVRSATLGAQKKWVQTAYGNWVRWSPPTPKVVEAPHDEVVVARSSRDGRSKRMKKTQKVEAAEVAQVQLKRKVKALERKCAELQQQAAAAANRGGAVPVLTPKSKEQVSATANIRSTDVAQSDGTEWSHTVAALTVTVLCWLLRLLLES